MQERKQFVVNCKDCRRDVPSGVKAFPFQSIVVTCPLCKEQRRHLPSEVFLGRPNHLVGPSALMATRFCMLLMFPTIFALGLKELGPKTRLGASVLVMAIIGGAVIAPVDGSIAERSHSMAIAFFVPLTCYLIVAYFAFIGSKVRIPAGSRRDSYAA